jgi:hypothetical protein
MIHLKLLEKQEQENPKNKMERNNKNKSWNQLNRNQKTIQRINESKSCFFEKKSKIDRPLAKLTKKRRGKTQISKISNAKVEIATNTMEVQKIIRDSFENLYSNKFENLEEMNRFLDTYDHQKLKHEDINHLNRSIMENEFEAAIVSQK